MRHATANIKGKGGRRKARPYGGKDVHEFRVTATWSSHPDRPARHHTTDRAAAKRQARHWADQLARVTVEAHVEYGTYRPLYELDGPALAAEREAKERAAREDEEARIQAELRRRAEARRAAVKAQRDRAQAAALMVQPPVPRTAQQRTARHTAGRR